jgi:hypothetical protein
MENNKEQEILDIRRDRLEEKKSRKLEAYERLKNKHIKLSESSYERHRQMIGVFPFGQPILIGHHSEKTHRSLLRRSDNAMRQSIEHDKAAKHYEERLHALQSNNAVYSDDPDAITKLKRKLEYLERVQARNKAINKIVKAKKPTYKQKIDQLVELLNCSNDEADRYFIPDFCGRIGIPDYELTNNGAEIRRCKKRIKELEAKLEYAAKVECEEREFECFKLVKNYVIDRIQFIFDSKPEKQVRDILKSNGFRWSPSESAWQRQLNPTAIWAAAEVIRKLNETNL